MNDIVMQFRQEEYSHLRAEERDRMNARSQIWTLFLSIVGAFGFLSTQSAAGAYITVLAPYVILFLAQYIRHNEGALKQIRKYLYKLAEDAGYTTSYEHWCSKLPHTTQGSYMDALRNALLLADALAMANFALHVPFIWLLVLLIDLPPVFLTLKWLHK